MTRSLLDAHGRVPASCLSLLEAAAVSFEALNDTTLAAECTKSVSAPVASVSGLSPLVCNLVGTVTDLRLNGRVEDVSVVVDGAVVAIAWSWWMW